MLLKIGNVTINLNPPDYISENLEPFTIKNHERECATLSVHVIQPCKGRFNTAHKNFVLSYFRDIYSKQPDSQGKDRKLKTAQTILDSFTGNELFDKLMDDIVRGSDGWTILSLNDSALLLKHKTDNGHLFLNKRFPEETHKANVVNAVSFIASLKAAQYGSLFLHGAGLWLNDRGYLFLGRSNSGKSTIASLAGNKSAIADDGIIAGFDEDGIYMMRSPLVQKAAPFANSTGKKYRVRKIFFIKKSFVTKLLNMRKTEALSDILKYHIHFYRYFDRMNSEKAFFAAHNIIGETDCFKLYFRKNNEFLKLIKD